MTTPAAPAASAREQTQTSAADARPAFDPLPILKGFASLRRLTGTYPAGHPMIAQKVRELINEGKRLGKKPE